MEVHNNLTDGPPPLQTHPRFIHHLGLFYNAWTAVDLTVDLAIGIFLKIPNDQALILTSGMQFGPKIRLLYEVVSTGDHPNKGAILGPLNKLRNDAKRNVFAHAYIVSTPTKVTFVERRPGGPFKVLLHTYTLEEWVEHVVKFAQASDELWSALGQPAGEYGAFVQAALNAAKS